MAVRHTLTEHRSTTIGVSIALIISATCFSLYSLRGQPLPPASTQAWYSDDDGQTWFADTADRIPAFDHNGKEAVRAAVFSYASGSKQLVAYLERFNPAAQKNIDAAIKAAMNDPQHQMTVPQLGDRSLWEIKAPGSGHGWLKQTESAAQRLLNPVSPDGSTLQSFNP